MLSYDSLCIVCLYNLIVKGRKLYVHCLKYDVSFFCFCNSPRFCVGMSFHFLTRSRWWGSVSTCDSSYSNAVPNALQAYDGVTDLFRSRPSSFSLSEMQPSPVQVIGPSTIITS